jgi:hypothetical protein
VNLAKEAAAREKESKSMGVAAWVAVTMVTIPSLQPVMNMLSPRQIMNTSFDPLDLVNTYGAFGSVGKERLNIVFEGTYYDHPGDSAQWKPYIYKGLPVLTNVRPPQVAPYHLRFDWQMWFAAMSSPDQYPWTLNLVWKLLHNDPEAIRLFAGNPFPDRPPRYIGAVLYRYRFASSYDPRGEWWTREQIGMWLPALSADNPQLTGFLRSNGWIR